MDKDLIAAEYMKIYFGCHPDQLPKDKNEALKVMMEMHKNYKSKIITDFKNKSEDFVNKFFDNDKGKYR